MGKNPSEQSAKVERVVVTWILSPYVKPSGRIGYRKSVKKETVVK